MWFMQTLSKCGHKSIQVWNAMSRCLCFTSVARSPNNVIKIKQVWQIINDSRFNSLLRLRILLGKFYQLQLVLSLALTRLISIVSKTNKIVFLVVVIFVFVFDQKKLVQKIVVKKKIQAKKNVGQNVLDPKNLWVKKI